MADLTQALSGLNFAGTDSAFGIGQQALAQATPQLINPYGSTGQALGISLGSVLLQSLLGYQAQKSAMEDTLATNKLANAMLRLQTPEDRTAFIETQATDPRIATRLSSLATALTGQQLVQQQLVAQEVARQEALGKFQLGPVGTKLFERDLEKVRQEAAMRVAALQASSAGKAGQPEMDPEDKKLTRFALAADNLAKQFDELNMTAAEFEIARKIPNSKAELAYSNLVGQLPNLARLGGQSAQISDLDTKQQMQSVLGPTIFDKSYSGTESIASRIRQKIKTAPFTPGYNPYEAATTSTTPAMQPVTGVSPERASKIQAINVALAKPGVSSATRNALLAKKEELMK